MLRVGVLEILVKGTVPTTGSGTKNFFNVFHYSLGSLPIPDTLTLIANQFLVQVWTPVSNCLSTSYTGVETLIRLLDDATMQYQNANTPANGQVAGARLPTDTAASYLFRTAERGKNFRGAKRFGTVAAADVVGDEITTAAITAHWGAATVALGNPITGGGLSTSYVPCVVSRMLSQTSVNPTSIQASTILSQLLNRTIGTMRRRKEKTVR